MTGAATCLFPRGCLLYPKAGDRPAGSVREAASGMISHTPYFLLLFCVVIFVLAAVVAKDCDPGR
jgi:hypothetical protein